jgi:hypothetical protein
MPPCACRGLDVVACGGTEEGFTAGASRCCVPPAMREMDFILASLYGPAVRETLLARRARGPETLSNIRMI